MSTYIGKKGLLENTNQRSTYKVKEYYFEGDLYQMNEARKVADNLGIKTGIKGGLPFVSSKEDFEKVTQYIVSHRVEGWWHYVSVEEYRKMNGK